jgi:ABC-2 type transport system ATP-binding protein
MLARRPELSEPPRAWRRFTSRGLTKRYGDVLAVADLSFAVRSGAVTGFLAPNGAGKTTTLRMMLGLARPTRGHAFIDGVPYRRLTRPAWVVGATLERSGAHPGRSGRNHLRQLAAAAGMCAARVDEVLALVELTEAADRRVSGFRSECNTGSRLPRRCSATPPSSS